MNLQLVWSLAGWGMGGTHGAQKHGVHFAEQFLCYTVLTTRRERFTRRRWSSGVLRAGMATGTTFGMEPMRRQYTHTVMVNGNVRGASPNTANTLSRATVARVPDTAAVTVSNPTWIHLFVRLFAVHSTIHFIHSGQGEGDEGDGRANVALNVRVGWLEVVL